MIDIQYDIIIMGGREVSRPYQVCFSSKASGFYPFGIAKRLFFMFLFQYPQYLTTEPFNGFNRV